MARAREIDCGLPTPRERAEKLQHSLHAKAKAEPSYRFYSLWDKICRPDILREAYRRSRAHRGAAGADAETFEEIESNGLDRWLGNLERELKAHGYAPQPLLRVWIPKSTGGQRPLSIPTIRDRVVQTAVLLILGPIFEADLAAEQYGFRPGIDAKAAIRQVFYHVRKSGRREVVDGDLRDYFGSIPHGPLMKCVARRIADGQILSVLRRWLKVSVIERNGGNEQRSALARRSKRGAAQGAPISPLLSNLYFRRFVLAWKQFGLEHRYGALIVNYADDFVMCCRPRTGAAVLGETRRLMNRLGLTIHDEKTRVVRTEEESFDFLGYTFGPCYGWNGRLVWGTRPSRAAVRSVLEQIREATTRQWTPKSAEDRVRRLNQILRGWGNYFKQGLHFTEFRKVQVFTERRLRRWLLKKRGQGGMGFRQYPRERLYALGLCQLSELVSNPPRAKA
jgi:group II intron reverse transcriptase/maturase